MAATVMDKDFKLITPDPVVKASVGDDDTLHCQLSPETSAVAMEIRWFNGTDCIYLYKNGHVTVREGYEGRVSVNTQELQRGDVSLRLRDIRGGDRGVYTCQVISGEHKEEGRVGLIIGKSPVPLL
ncbi:myelin-oligodendrocyte glycoprotein-like [Clupea harengus]|uniref:Myelin-oligodendrocyte glycoprotein-like n=1 Tax=Clupea harengus TaxID=7950 RepID=A0A8M1KEF7_CLUHA|nr:myelin-oligodendrocyte glycoprotein-like [Clupea harengus]